MESLRGSDPAVGFVPEPDGFQADWIGLCQPYGASPKVVSDAYLAAIAIRLNIPLAQQLRPFSLQAKLAQP